MTGHAATLPTMTRRRRADEQPDPDVIDPAGRRHQPCSRCGSTSWNVEEHVPFGIYSPRFRTFRIRCTSTACGFVLVTARLPSIPHHAGTPQPRQRLIPARQLPRHRRP